MMATFGGESNDGQYIGVSLEKNSRQVVNQLREMVRMRKSLKDSNIELGVKKEAAESKINSFIKDCLEGGK
jgi:hypothetical protein